MDINEAWKAVLETTKASKDAWEAVEATPAYKAWEKADIEASKAVADAWKAVEATPEYKDYWEANEAMYTTKEAYDELWK